MRNPIYAYESLGTSTGSSKISARNRYIEEVYTWSKEVKETEIPKTLSDYINLHLTINSIGAFLSIITLCFFISMKSVGASMVTTVISLIFIEMMVTVAIDKKTSHGTHKARH